MTEPFPACEVCGRGPAAQLTLRRHVGMVIFQRFYKYKGPLCRDHGVENAREWLRLTAVQGWWGIVSFFVNFYAVLTDVIALRKAKTLPPPDETG